MNIVEDGAQSNIQLILRRRSLENFPEDLRDLRHSAAVRLGACSSRFLRLLLGYHVSGIPAEH